ncbi:MAG: hypothetical protein A4E50_01796 [Methanosaeta sp. PtaB.Bin087]|jgi:hypothetical protein|nr:MAG: hypothetical protein A4E50_01796 [Methanosaeta sp. PtaB.Bin087]OPY57230.1 MAG: hypothetical protein A4E51_00091 [Methanosaeta sp. PtaU1.Bin055]
MGLKVRATFGRIGVAPGGEEVAFASHRRQRISLEKRSCWRSHAV